MPVLLETFAKRYASVRTCRYVHCNRRYKRTEVTKFSDQCQSLTSYRDIKRQRALNFHENRPMILKHVTSKYRPDAISSNVHSRPQRLRSIWPAPWIETSGRLQFSVRDSRTSDLSAQSRAFIKMVDQAINFGQEIQNFSDITLKEKQYEVLKLLVVEEKDVLAVLPTGYGKSLIYYLLPPV